MSLVCKRVVLLPEANAKNLTFVAEGVTVSAVDVGNGRTMITLESATPDDSTALGLALGSWLSRTSWNQLGGFPEGSRLSYLPEPEPKKRKKRRKKP